MVEWEEHFIMPYSTNNVTGTYIRLTISSTRSPWKVSKLYWLSDTVAL